MLVSIPNNLILLSTENFKGYWMDLDRIGLVIGWINSLNFTMEKPRIHAFNNSNVTKISRISSKCKSFLINVRGFVISLLGGRRFDELVSTKA